MGADACAQFDDSIFSSVENIGKNNKIVIIEAAPYGEKAKGGDPILIIWNVLTCSLLEGMIGNIIFPEYIYIN